MEAKGILSLLHQLEGPWGFPTGPPGRSREREFSVIVAVGSVRVVEMAVDQVANVASVWNGGVAAARAMHVSGLVPLAVMIWSADLGMRGVRGNLVLIHVISVARMEVPVVQIVDVVSVLDGNVTAVSAVNVIVPFVNGVCHGHTPLLLSDLRAAGPSGFSLECSRALWMSSVT